jgi:hypothetical protein
LLIYRSELPQVALESQRKNLVLRLQAVSLSPANTDVAKAKKAIFQKKRAFGPDSTQRTVTRQSIGVSKVSARIPTAPVPGFVAPMQAMLARACLHWLLHGGRPGSSPRPSDARDTTLAFASQAPRKDIKRLKARMGWELIPWYTLTADFDKDFGVDEWHGTNRRA